MRIKEIILFGSRARGDHKPNSDWDIAVKVDKGDEKYAEEWLKRIKPLLPPSIDLCVYNIWKEQKDRDNIDKEGIILCKPYFA
jgi:predicted nucleotidyltransferase